MATTRNKEIQAMLVQRWTGAAKQMRSLPGRSPQARKFNESIAAVYQECAEGLAEAPFVDGEVPACTECGAPLVEGEVTLATDRTGRDAKLCLKCGERAAGE